MLFKLTVLALLGLVACQAPTPDGVCPPTSTPLTHLPDKNSCVYYFVCHNGEPLLMPRCRQGHIWDGTRCREGVCEDLPPTTTTDPNASTSETTTLDPDATTETAQTAPPVNPTAPIIPPTVPELNAFVVTLP